MQTISLGEAQSHLTEILESLAPGEEVVITRDDRPLARLINIQKQPRPGPGLCKGMITIIAEDDDHLTDFTEYMP